MSLQEENEKLKEENEKLKEKVKAQQKIIGELTNHEHLKDYQDDNNVDIQMYSVRLPVLSPGHPLSRVRLRL